MAETDIDAEAIELRNDFDYRIVHPMDDQAVTAVYHAIRDIFFLSLVSPKLITETALFSIRAAGMIRAAAYAYGQKPGRLGLMRLIKHVLADAALLSTTMIVMRGLSHQLGNLIRKGSDFVAGGAAFAVDAYYPGIGTAIGSGVRKVGDVAASATESIDVELVDSFTAAMRMAQLGLLTITVVRPMTLSKERRQELYNQLEKRVFLLRRQARGKLKDEQVDDESPTAS
jgi:hypothetical protein